MLLLLLVLTASFRTLVVALITALLIIQTPLNTQVMFGSETHLSVLDFPGTITAIVQPVLLHARSLSRECCSSRFELVADTTSVLHFMCVNFDLLMIRLLLPAFIPQGHGDESSEIWRR